MPPPVKRLRIPDVSMEELVVAYRHTKAELFAERSIPSRLALLKYEEDLVGNLKKLWAKINRGLDEDGGDWIKDEEFLGPIVTQPKEIEFGESVVESERSASPHLYVTEAKSRWESVKSSKRPIAKFRTMSLPSIEFQILGVIWITKAGHLLDQELLPCCRGNRLKRLSDSGEESDNTKSPINDESPQIFRPYHFAYRNWRKDGLKAIDAEIERDNRVIGITMDLRRYYHRIDPAVLSNPKLWTETFGIRMDRQQSHLTDLLSKALVAWAASSPEKTGIPVGLLASRVIANALLHDFDKAMSEDLNPVFYARYVDDILLVIRPSKKLKTAEEIMRFVSAELGELADLHNEDHTLILNLPHVGTSKLEFGAGKQRIFDFQGRSGRDLLATINKEIDELSSEFRLLPDISEEDGSVLKQALIADHDLELGADCLRKADSLTIRRMGLAILLRNHELLERCMSDPKQWESIRKPFYKLIEEHVLTPERYCTYFQYLPRIFGLIAANGDWAIGEVLLKRLEWVQSEIEALETESNNHA